MKLGNQNPRMIRNPSWISYNEPFLGTTKKLSYDLQASLL